MNSRTIFPLPRTEILSLAEWTESRNVALFHTRAALDAARDRIGFKVAAEIEISEATQSAWDAIAEGVEAEVIYSVGGGLPVDAAKYVAAKKNLPLICIPTALTVDAFLTWASGVRVDGCVRYLVTKPPDKLLIDFDLLAAAPKQLRAAGICDVLSIATGLWDWRYAEEQGLNPAGMEYIPYVAKCAEAILEGALDCAAAAGAGDHGGLKQLLDCLAVEVQLCNQIGHSRPEEGSEHYFAYAVENVMGKGLPHGDLVGPGIILMAALQEQDVAPLRAALEDCSIPLKNIPENVVQETLRQLPEYCNRHSMPHGLAHDISDAMIEEASKIL